MALRPWYPLGTLHNPLEVSGGGDTLQYLYLLNAGFTGVLDMSGKTSLLQANCNGNAFTSATFAGCPSLTLLDIGENLSLASLDVSGCVLLELLNADNCAPLAALDVSDNTLLESLSVQGCALLETLDVAGCTLLTVLNVANCDIMESLDASGLALLTELYVASCDIMTSIDISGCSTLVSLDASGLVALETLIVTDCDSLASLGAIGCAIADVSVLNAILVALDANGLENGEVDLSGGTNAIPTGAGAAAVVSLEGKGWTVTVNT